MLLVPMKCSNDASLVSLTPSDTSGEGVTAEGMAHKEVSANVVGTASICGSLKSYHKYASDRAACAA